MKTKKSQKSQKSQKVKNIKKQMSVKTIKKIILKKDRTFPTIHNIHGYNVILIDIPSSELVYIQSYVNVGFLFETKKNCGISHLLEHVLVNSWEQCVKHPCLEVLTEKGIQCNAHTGITTTNYHTTSTKESFGEMIDYIATITTSAKITQQNVNREINPVFNELKELGNNPKNQLWNLIQKELFCSEGGKYSNDWDTQVKTLKNINAKMLSDYYKKHYVPENTTFVICGDIDKKNVLDIMSNVIQSPKCTLYNSNLTPCFNKLDENKYIFHQRKDSRNALCSFTYISDDIDDNNDLLVNFSLSCLRHALFMRLRYKNKMTYYLKCSSSRSHCGREITILYETSHNNIKESHDVVLNVVEKYKNEFFSKSVITSRKKHVLINYEKTNQSNPEIIANHYMNQFLYNNGALYSPKHMNKKVAIITKNEIKGCLEKCLNKYIFGYQSVKSVF